MYKARHPKSIFLSCLLLAGLVWLVGYSSGRGNKAPISSTGIPPLSFREPVDKVSISQNCMLGGVCAGSENNRHTGVDYSSGNSGSNTDTPGYAVNFGVLRQKIDWDDASICKSKSCNMGNMVILEHLLKSGEKILSLSAHLFSKNVGNLGSRIARSQNIGIVGNSGSTLHAWGNGSATVNNHLHLEMKKPDLGYRDIWPFGYMDQSEANTLKLPTESSITIDTALHRVFRTISDMQSDEVLVPYFSFASAQPTVADYEVYGIANYPLNASVTLLAPTSKSFTNIGVGGRFYDSDASNRDIFNVPTASLSSNQAQMFTGGRMDLAAGDYRFFAYVNTSDRGYPIKLSILPNAKSLRANNT